MSKSRKLRY